MWTTIVGGVILTSGLVSIYYAWKREKSPIVCPTLKLERFSDLQERSRAIGIAQRIGLLFVPLGVVLSAYGIAWTHQG